MSEIQTETTPDETPAEVDPIKPLFEADCPSISGRSTLTFVVGKHDTEGTWHLRIAGNSGKGMWFDGWASAADIESIVKGATELTAKSFHSLHPGRSINTGGFVLAALKHLGLIRANELNTRLHEHVPTETFEKVATAVIDPASAAKKSKASKAKAKEATT
jgi:hypothetical protein